MSKMGKFFSSIYPLIEALKMNLKKKKFLLMYDQRCTGSRFKTGKKYIQNEVEYDVYLEFCSNIVQIQISLLFI